MRLRLARDFLSAKLNSKSWRRSTCCGWRAISYRLNCQTIATIEQQREQIVKLHGFVRRIGGTAGIPNAVEACRLICNLVDEALAATEPK